MQNTIFLAKSSRLRFNSNIAKQVWVYTLPCIDSNNRITILNNKPFKSLGEVAAFLSVSSATILYYLDNFKVYKGYYFFTDALDTEGMEILLEQAQLDRDSSPAKSQVEIWVYDWETISLLNNTTFPSIQAVMDYFKVGRKTVLNYLDTDKVLKSKETAVYLYSQELSAELAGKLINNLDIVKSKVNSGNIWVYKNNGDNNLVLVFDKPFTSINQVNRVLKISNHTIKKYLDSNSAFKDYYFYSDKIESFAANTLISNFKEPVDSYFKKSIWVYQENWVGGKLTLELLKDKPFNTITEAAKVLKMSDMTIKKYLDLFTAFRGLYFFSEGQSEESLINNTLKTKEGIWVYNKLDADFVLLPNQPFKSKWVASKALKVSHKIIEKYLDSGESYRDFYFFSQKLD